jgi:nitrite reductase/ring-hydroxylating ferredoxin subunit
MASGPRPPVESSEPRPSLAGDTSASVYKPPADRELHTVPPDGRPHDEQPAWRQDFPIDWPQDHYVARRDFTKFLLLTSLAFTVGQFWIAAQNFIRRRRGKPPIRRIASLAEMSADGTVVFKYPGEHDDCVLVRTADGGLLAYSQKCTHLACAVVPDADKNTIHCPCHEGYFDLATGRPIAGPPRRPLPRITLEVRGDDVYATGVEVSTV